jgi:glycosyltransferase involved in cell wall biosynthesis
VRVSVAVATYNGAKYIADQLESFTIQTRLPDQLVIADDGSTDDTINIVTRFARSAPFEVQIHQNLQNLGYARNFSQAAALCSGDIIFFSDQDDVWLPEKVETVVREAERRPDMQLFMNDAFITDGRLTKTGQTILGRIRGAGMGDDRFLHGSCMGVRRSFLDIAFPLPAGVNAHDTWLVGLASDYDARLIIDEPLQLYRRHEDATSRASVTGRTDRLTKYAYYKDLVRDRLKGDTVGFLDYYLTDTDRRLARVRAWLSTAAETNELYARSMAVAAVLEQRRDAIRARIALLDGPSYKRPPGVVALAAQGRYKVFNGARTAVRDALFLDHLFRRLGERAEPR